MPRRRAVGRAFSFEAAIEQASAVRPLEVGSPVWQGRTAQGRDAGDWMQQPARIVLPWLAASLGVLAGASIRIRRNVTPPAGRSLLRLLSVCALLWLALQYGMTLLAGGIIPATSYASLLKGYIVFLSLRCELLVAFAAALAAAVAVYLKAEAWVRACRLRQVQPGSWLRWLPAGQASTTDDASWIDWLPSVDYRSVQAVEFLLLFLVLWCALFVLYQAAARRPRPDNAEKRLARRGRCVPLSASVRHRSLEPKPGWRRYVAATPPRRRGDHARRFAVSGLGRCQYPARKRADWINAFSL